MITKHNRHRSSSTSTDRITGVVRGASATSYLSVAWVTAKVTLSYVRFFCVVSQDGVVTKDTDVKFTDLDLQSNAISDAPGSTRTPMSQIAKTALPACNTNIVV